MVLRINLFVWDLDRGSGELSGLLSDAEAERAARFAFDVDRARFTAARGRVREILAGYTDHAARELVFETGPHGKPSLAGGPAYNFSDSGNLGCLAIGRDEAIGVDIEFKRARDFAALAQRYFAPAEQARFAGTPEPDRINAFYRAWTRKEAFLKAIGSGLATRLDAFEVTFDTDQPPRMLRIDPSIDSDLSAWSLHALDIAPEFEGALAIRNRGEPVEIVVRETVRR